MRSIMNAAFRMVHEIGTDLVAALLKKSPGTVCHEVNPNHQGSAKLGLVDAVLIMLAFNRFDILYAMAEACGFVVVPMRSAPGDAESGDILARAGAMAKEFGESVTQLSAALSDGKLSPNEVAKFDQETLELVESVMEVRRAVHAKADKDAGRLKVVA